MALQKTITTPHGFTASGAYHRVEGVYVESKTKIKFSLRSYKNASESVSFQSTEYSCAYDLNGSNPIQQAYTYLKSADDFSSAEDV